MQRETSRKSNIFITLRFADDRTEFFPAPSPPPFNRAHTHPTPPSPPSRRVITGYRAPNASPSPPPPPPPPPHSD